MKPSPRLPKPRYVNDADNMLRLYQLGIRVQAIAEQYHLSPNTVQGKIREARKRHALSH